MVQLHVKRRSLWLTKQTNMETYPIQVEEAKVFVRLLREITKYQDKSQFEQAIENKLTSWLEDPNRQLTNAEKEELH